MAVLTPCGHRTAALWLVLASTAGGCGKDPAREAGADGALGGDARVVTLARAEIERPPAAGAAWIAWRIALRPGERMTHRHALSTVYAQQASHTLVAGGRAQQLEVQQGAVVRAGQRHVHQAGDAGAIFWDVLLARRGTRIPNADEAERVFESGPLEGVPERPRLAFLAVTLPPGGGRTTVHTHPGSETIFVTDGPFEYQNGLEGSSTVDDGASRSIPPDTAVQKRNPGTRPARFLSWFLVDPARPFAPPATFDEAS